MVIPTMGILQVFLAVLPLIFLNKEVFGSFACPITFTQVGCFHDSGIKPRPLPQLLITDRDKGCNKYSGKPIHWGGWDVYLSDIVCRCAEQAKAKGYNVFGVQHYGECWSGCESEDTYARDGRSDKCITYDFRPCGPQDKYCVGKNVTSFIYTLHGLQSPKVAAKLNSLNCQNFVVAIRKSPCAAASPTIVSSHHAHSILKNVQDIYRGYSCLQCLKIVNESSSAVFLMLKFTCHGEHLKKLVTGIGATRIIKAECSIPHCASIHSTYPCSYSCGVSSCSITPSLPYPSICPVPVHYPVQMLPRQCPLSCPSVCAPACNSLCCQSFIGRTNSAEQQPPSQYVTEQDRLGDAEAVEGNTYI